MPRTVLNVWEFWIHDRWKGLLHIKQAYRTTTQRRVSDMVEIVSVMDSRRKDGLSRTDHMCSVKLSSEAGKRMNIQLRGCYQVHDEEKATLMLLGNALDGVGVAGGEGPTASSSLTFF